ncbi:hypothetical protein GW17_00031348 [Ensete ventricosum]|nr:hypothetical protein GW17_00031348 [Ensete ventricosum]
MRPRSSITPQSCRRGDAVTNLNKAKSVTHERRGGAPLQAGFWWLHGGRVVVELRQIDSGVANTSGRSFDPSQQVPRPPPYYYSSYRSCIPQQESLAREVPARAIRGHQGMLTTSPIADIDSDVDPSASFLVGSAPLDGGGDNACLVAIAFTSVCVSACRCSSERGGSPFTASDVAPPPGGSRRRRRRRARPSRRCGTSPAISSTFPSPDSPEAAWSACFFSLFLGV